MKAPATMTAPARSAILVVVMAAVGCGHQKVAMRSGEALPCVDRARSQAIALPDGKSQKSRIIGWISVASVDRWVKEIDRIGQRAGMFAPGSSYREHLLRRGTEVAREIGLKDLSWLDQSRPTYLVAQEQGPAVFKGKQAPAEIAWIFGLTGILPTKGADLFDASLRPDVRAAAPDKGHKRQLKVANNRFYVDPLNHYTELVTLHPDRLALATPSARCLHTRTPSHLFIAGVAVGDLYRHYRPQIEKLMAEALSDLPDTGAVREKTGAAIRKLAGWAGKYLEQTDVMDLTANADERRVTFGFSYRALPGTDAAARVKRMSASKPNQLMPRLPATAWWATGETYAGIYDPSDFDAIFEMYAGMLDLGDGTVARLRKFVRDWLALLGDHGASAMYIDGRFPFAYVNAVQSKDPEGLIKLMTDGLVDLIKVAEEAQAKAAKLTGKPPKPVSPKAQELLDKLKTKDLGALITELVQSTQTAMVRFTYEDKKAAGVRCRTLAANADMKQLSANRVARRVVAFTGTPLQFSLCTTAKQLIMLMGPDTFSEARRMVAGGGANLGGRKSYQRVVAGKRPPLSLLMLDPRPQFKVFGRMLPVPIKWPEDDAISMTCSAKGERAGCSLDLPIAIIDVVRQVSEAFGLFGK